MDVTGKNMPMLINLKIEGKMATIEEIGLYFDGALPTYQATVSGDADLLEHWIAHRIAINTADEATWTGPRYGYGAKQIETAIETK